MGRLKNYLVEVNCKWTMAKDQIATHDAKILFAGMRWLLSILK